MNCRHQFTFKYKNSKSDTILKQSIVKKILENNTKEKYKCMKKNMKLSNKLYLKSGWWVYA